MDNNEIVTLNLTKVVPKIFDERLPYRGFLKGESENISSLRSLNKEGHIGWVNLDSLGQIAGATFVAKYKTKDGKEIVPEIEPSIIEKDIDLTQDINVNPERFAKTFGQEKLSPKTINHMISDRRHGHATGRRIVVNAEVDKDPFGRFRYTKVRFTSSKNLHSEDQFKTAINAVNVLVTKYRRITGDYWITKVREEDVFIYKAVKDDSFDLSYTAQGIGQIRPDHNHTTVNDLRESLMANDEPGFPFQDFYLDALNAFEQANYDLSIVYSVTALESIVKTYLVLYYRPEPQATSDKVLRMTLDNLVTIVLPLIFHEQDYKNLLNGVIEAISLRNKIIHQSELGIGKNKSKSVVRNVGLYMEFIQRKIQRLLNEHLT
jgi:hypothetical protein